MSARCQRPPGLNRCLVHAPPGFPSASIGALTQCNIASVVRKAECCEPEPPPRCLKDLAIQRVADAWTKFSVPRPRFLSRRLSFADVRRQIEDHRPIQVGAGVDTSATVC